MIFGSMFAAPLSPWLRAAASIFVVILVSKLSLLLSAPAQHLTLFWPLAGIGLALVYYWGWPAVFGIVVGDMLYFATENWQWFDLLRAPVSGFAWQDVAAVAAHGIAGGLQALLGAHILRRAMPSILDGSRGLVAWLGLLFLIGPLACLIKPGVAALALGWVALPLRAQTLIFPLAMWVANVLPALMVAPAIVLRELRHDMPRAARSPWRSPWLAFALVAIPAWLFASYANVQQAAQATAHFRAACEELRADLQGELDAAVQRLRALRAFYRSSGEVSAAQFDQFADELLDRSPLLLGLGWAQPVPSAQRVAFEAQLEHDAGHATPIKEFDAAGDLVVAAARGEYWPLLRVAPQTRRALVGFDLASEPARRDALLASQGGALAVSARVISARADGEHVPAVFLYLATQTPRGAVVAPIKVEALLDTAASAKQLLRQDHGLILVDADNRLIAALAAPREAGASVDPDWNQTLELKLGGDRWRLTVTTQKTALPFLTAALWWFGQLLPQLLCIATGLLLALSADHDRKLLALERHYAGYLERQHQDAAPQTLPAQRFDAAIDDAWRQRAFEPRFEPIVDLRSGEIRGAEALLRWQGAPAELMTEDIIDWAERHRTIAEVDQAMLDAALRAAATWPIARAKPFTLAVNISPSELQDPNWAGGVLDALARARLPGRHLCIEITEGILVKSDSLALGQLARLRAAGVRIALDDFGTGYSSIGYLRQLPVDRIKLDRVFVSELASDLKARQIVASIVALGRSLGIDLVAEGVEDTATADVLLDLGCPLAQGRLFSQAVTVAAMHKLIADEAILYSAKAAPARA